MFQRYAEVCFEGFELEYDRLELGLDTMYNYAFIHFQIQKTAISSMYIYTLCTFKPFKWRFIPYILHEWLKD